MRQNDSADKDVEMARIAAEAQDRHERRELFNTAIICTSILIGLGIVCFTYLAATKPAWITALGMILGTITSSGVISIPVVRRYRKNTKRLRERLKPLEEVVAVQENEIRRLRQSSDSPTLSFDRPNSPGKSGISKDNKTSKRVPGSHNKDTDQRLIGETGGDQP
jgi:glucan phosphoethanolaminetransferase (alkaline phosphatase superfamily)